MRLEFLGLKWAMTEKCREYLLGHKCVVFTDNNPLSHLSTAKLGATEQRWAAQLASFDFEIKYRSGRSNGNADALSRQHPPGVQDLEAMLPSTSLPLPLRQALPVAQATQAAVIALPHHTQSDMEALQQADPVLQEFLVFWRRRQRPSNDERKQLSRQALALLRQWDRLVERSGVLYRQIFRSDGAEAVLQLLLPAALREQVLTEVHQRHGHQGIERTLELLRQRCYWPGMSSEVARAPMGHLLASRPNEILAIDFTVLEPTYTFSYRVGHATVAVIVKEVAGAIWTALVEETMPVPQTEDWRAIAAGFQERWIFPNCVGAIDGKHVVIQAPANSGSLYFNYKSSHSLVLLAVVDAEYLFRVVDVGGFGRSSDGGSLQNSAFGESLRDGSLQLPPDTVIPGAERLGLLPHVFVGDEAFPLLDNLLRPFPGRQLTRERRLFNYRLSRARLVVECAFGILSSQWRMFRRVITTSPEVTELCVKATCVLHNFLRRKTIGRSSRTPVVPVVAESSDEAPTLRDAPMMGSNNATRRSIQLRETFCSYLNEEGVVSWQHKVV
ncbi:uncharacterized protein LOC117551727 [Gymnodraco acuticeps]|uniref:Gypsy retrotransposon integrase-like protein 1 n=1 Tax=Gymnodraco acuticeps TaxID=8218 RepID=A0A6P8V5A4_GYMAC|nr:uncharacterized protein LOC117551727 [Gymnodraco acuticeps]